MSGDSLDTWFEGGDDPTAEVPAERYGVQGVLGRGAMGVVEAVEDRRLRRVVARKTLLRPMQVEAFRREAQLTASLEHPAIVPIYDASEGPDGPWYTMRRVEGPSLRDAMAGAGDTEGRLALVQTFLRLCEAMAYVHEQGLVHRDLKPANVLLGAFGEVVVVDFGLAARAGDEASAGRVVGSPAYMSPEAARGEAPDPRMDVWALGSILHEMLSGERRHVGSASEVVERLRTLPSHAVQAIPDVPPELVAIVGKAMAPAGVRYPDAGALRADVEAFANGRLVGAHAYSTAELLSRFVQRTRGYLLMGLATFLLIVVVVVMAGLRVSEDRDRAVAAEAERTRQLALALEARARALGVDPRAPRVAREALAIDPTLPWARGVLAEFPAGTEVEVVADLSMGCQDVFGLTAERLLLRCDDSLRLVAVPDGQLIDEVAFEGWNVEAGGEGWAVARDGSFVARITLDGDRLRIERRRRAVIEDAEASALVGFGDEVFLVGDRGETLMVIAMWGPEAGSRWELPDGRVRPTGSASHPSGHVLFGAGGTLRCAPDLRACERIAVPGVVKEAVWSDDGSRVLLLATTGEAYVVLLATGDLVLMERGRAGGTVDLVRRPEDGVAVLGAGGRVEFFDSEGSLLHEVDASDLRPRSVAATGPYVWVVGRGGVRGVTLRGAGPPAVRRFPNGVGALAAGDGALYASHDDRVYRVDARRPALVRAMGSFVKGLAVHEGRLHVGTTSQGVLRLGEADDGSDDEWLHDAGVRRVASGPPLAWLTNDGAVMTEARVVTRSQAQSDLGAGGGRVVAIDDAETVVVYDLATGSEVTRVATGGEVWGLAMAPDGQRVAYALDDHRVRELDLASGEERLLPGAHRSFVPVLAYGPDGRLASGSWDGTSLLWRDGALEAALEGHVGRVTTLVFTDADTLYTGSWDQTLRRWDLSAWRDLSGSPPVR